MRRHEADIVVQFIAEDTRQVIAQSSCRKAHSELPLIRSPDIVLPGPATSGCTSCRSLSGRGRWYSATLLRDRSRKGVGVSAAEW